MAFESGGYEGRGAPGCAPLGAFVPVRIINGAGWRLFGAGSGMFWYRSYCFWCRCDFRGGTCAGRSRIMAISGAGWPLFLRPAPECITTCSRNTGLASETRLLTPSSFVTCVETFCFLSQNMWIPNSSDELYFAVIVKFLILNQL